MNKKQYNNVIENTLKHEQTEDSLSTARAIFDNMGVALPQGDMKTVYETIKTDNYMGWRSCTMQEAQEAANNGSAAIGISEDKIVVLSANDEEQPVTETPSVMSLNENTSAFAVDGMRYYAYICATTTTPHLLVNGWLKLYTSPTVCRSGRTVNIPTVQQYTGSDGVVYKFTNRNYWCTQQPAMQNYINSSAVSQITAVTGFPPVIKVGSKGELTDETGRYWIAVGPNVVNPNHQPNQTPSPSEMYAKGVLDIVLKDENGTRWYIPAIVGGTKAHTWTNGIIQTWKSFPSGHYDSAKNYSLPGNVWNGAVAVEFIGPSSSAIEALKNAPFEIEKIIFYDN